MAVQKDEKFDNQVWDDVDDDDDHSKSSHKINPSVVTTTVSGTSTSTVNFEFSNSSFYDGHFSRQISRIHPAPIYPI